MANSMSAIAEHSIVKTVTPFLVAGIIALLIIGSNSNEGPYKFTRGEASVYVVQSIKANLKCPSTADFSYTSQNIKKVNDSTFTVSGHFDSQNGFGALIRSDYWCRIFYSKSKNEIKIKDLEIK